MLLGLFGSGSSNTGSTSGSSGGTSSQGTSQTQTGSSGSSIESTETSTAQSPETSGSTAQSSSTSSTTSNSSTSGDAATSSASTNDEVSAYAPSTSSRFSRPVTGLNFDALGVGEAAPNALGMDDRARALAVQAELQVLAMIENLAKVVPNSHLEELDEADDASNESATAAAPNSVRKAYLENASANDLNAFDEQNKEALAA